MKKCLHSPYVGAVQALLLCTGVGRTEGLSCSGTEINIYSTYWNLSHYFFRSFLLNFWKSFVKAQKEADFGTIFPSLSRYSLQNSI